MKKAVPIITLGLISLSGNLQAETVSITRQDCSRLIRHQPAPDVAYQPGVDAYGREVAPADLPGSAGQVKLLPEVLQFNININPVDYQTRNALAKQKADAQNGIVASQQAKSAAESQITSLNSQKAALVTKAAKLAGEKVTLDNALAPLQLEVDSRQRHKTNPTYVDALAAVTAKQAEIDANTKAQASVTSQIAAQQAVVDAAPAKEAALTQQQTTVEAKQSALSAKGLDSTQMTAATIHYDIGKNQFFINGQSLTSPELQELAEACAKAGVK